MGLSVRINNTNTDSNAISNAEARVERYTAGQETIRLHIITARHRGLAELADKLREAEISYACYGGTYRHDNPAYDNIVQLMRKVSEEIGQSVTLSTKLSTFEINHSPY